MAARWVPKNNDPIANQEYIGRRLFYRKKLKGSFKTKSSGFDLTHFEESRDEGNVSVDRLGKTSFDKKVRNYLEPRANYAATKQTPEADFIGWAVVQAKDLFSPQGPNLSIVPDPLPHDGTNDLSENYYHAYIPRPEEYRTGPYASYSMAVHLKMIFDRKNQLEFSKNENKKSLFQNLKMKILGLSSFLLKKKF